MKELEPEIAEFPYERQYQIVGWRVLIETLKAIGAEVTVRDTRLSLREKRLKMNMPYKRSVRLLGHTAAHDMMNFVPKIIEMNQNGSKHDSFMNRTLMMHGAADDGPPINAGMLDTLQLYYSDDMVAQEDIRRFKLDRFDEFMKESEGNIIDFTVEQLKIAMKSNIDRHVLNALDNAQGDGSFYAGEWDKDRMLAQKVTTIQLPDQLSQTPRSLTLQQPEQPRRLRA